MAETLHCTKEAEIGEIKAILSTLAADNKWSEKRFDKIESKLDDISALNTAISVMSVSLEHIVEHNQKQDEMMTNQNKTLENINSNLNRLNQGQADLDSKVLSLEKRVTINENLNTIDLRAINKDKNETYLKKYAVPLGVGLSVGMVLIEIMKFFVK